MENNINSKSFIFQDKIDFHLKSANFELNLFSSAKIILSMSILSDTFTKIANFCCCKNATFCDWQKNKMSV